MGFCRVNNVQRNVYTIVPFTEIDGIESETTIFNLATEMNTDIYAIWLEYSVGITLVQSMSDFNAEQGRCAAFMVCQIAT
jgi:hypothetical protein